MRLRRLVERPKPSFSSGTKAALQRLSGFQSSEPFHAKHGFFQGFRPNAEVSKDRFEANRQNLMVDVSGFRGRIG